MELKIKKKIFFTVQKFKVYEIRYIIKNKVKYQII